MKNNPLSNIYISNGIIIDCNQGKETKLTCGLCLSGITMDNASNLYCGNVEHALRSLLQSLPKDYSLQVRFANSGSYSSELEQYYQTSETKGNDWSRSYRNFRYSQLNDYIECDIVSRKEVHIFVSRKIASKEHKRLTDKAMTVLLESEAHSFSNVMEHIRYSFRLVGGKVEMLDDNQLFHEYDKQLNPSIVPYDTRSAIHRFQPEQSISECCLHGDMSASTVDDCGFYYDGFHHSILILKALPSFTSSGMITQLTNLPIKNYSITMLIKPLDLEQEVTKEEKKASVLQRALSSSDQARLRVKLERSNERIDRLASGKTTPHQIQIIIHVWDKDINTLRNDKITMLKSAILRFQRSQYYVVDNPVTARNYFLATLPGSVGQEKAFQHQIEDVIASNLLPISGNHDNTLNGAEATYQTTSNGIFGISLFKNPNGDPYTNHGLITGKTGYGKSAGTIDLLTQIQPHTDTIFIIEDGNSYGGYVSTFGKNSNSFHVDINGSHTFNYLDTGGLPLSARHRSDVSAILKLMIHEDERHLVSKSKIGELAYLFYRDHFDKWKQNHPERFEQVCLEFSIAKDCAKTRKHNGLVSNFYPEYLEWKQFSPDEYQTAQQYFASTEADVDGADLLQFTFAFMTKEEMPTHSQFHEWLTKRAVTEENLLRLNLRNWCVGEGDYGCLFDGISTVNFAGSIVHVELGRIADTDKQLKALAGFIVSNYIRNTITLMPRSKRKLVVFEELGKFLTIDNADRIVADFYERGRKYNCTVLTVVQQITKIEPLSLRNSILGNSSIALCFRQEDTENAETLQRAFKLPEATKLAMTNLHTPTREKGSQFIVWQADDNEPMIHSACNIVSKEMLWVIDSSGDHYEEKQQALAKHNDVLEGIKIEANC